MANIKKLIFVYNLNSSPFSQAIDFFKKKVSPQTFSCNLYKVTHDDFLMKKEWEEFTKELPIQVKFYHRDMFKKKYPEFDAKFPVVLKEIDGQFNVFISTDEISGTLSLKELMKIVSEKLS